MSNQVGPAGPQEDSPLEPESIHQVLQSAHHRWWNQDLMPMLLQFQSVGVVLRKIHGGNGWCILDSDLLIWGVVQFFLFLPTLYETDARWSVPRWYLLPSFSGWDCPVGPERSSAFSGVGASAFQDSTRWFQLLWRQHFRKSQDKAVKWLFRQLTSRNRFPLQVQEFLFP